jgi:hypothetical protein
VSKGAPPLLPAEVSAMQKANNTSSKAAESGIHSETTQNTTSNATANPNTTARNVNGGGEDLLIRQLESEVSLLNRDLFPQPISAVLMQGQSAQHRDGGANHRGGRNS